MKTLNLEGRQETGVGRRRKGRGVLEKREGEYRGGTVAFSCTLLPPHLQLPRPSPSLVSSPLFPSLTLFLTTFLDILVYVLPSPLLVFLQLMQKRKWTRKTSTAKNHPAERDQLGEALQGFFIVPPVLRSRSEPRFLSWSRRSRLHFFYLKPEPIFLGRLRLLFWQLKN